MYKKVHLIQILFLVVGATGFAMLGPILKKEGKLNKEPNILHLKGSPFGRTLALAMRGPVDVYWHRGEVHDHGPGEECGPDCGHDHGEEHLHGPDCDHGEDCEHDHGTETESIGVLAAKVEDLVNAHGHDHGHDHDHAEHDCDEHGCEHGHAGHDHDCDEHGCEDDHEEAVVSKGRGARTYLLDTIEGMRQAYYSRSNKRSNTALHRAYIMGETQRRLSLSYQMDPTNIACYGSYFLFLSEAIARVEGGEEEHGIIRARQQAALNLANYTVQYCLRYQDEAPAMVTAANAAHDYLQIHLSDPGADLEVAERFLRILDGSLQRFEAIRAEMMKAGTWEKFNVYRRGEMEGAYSLVRKLRDADFKVFGERSKTAPVSTEETGS